MAQITLKANEVRQLSEFLKRHNRDTFFVAKDHGAYVGATAGSNSDGTFENLIFYFTGCNPHKDSDYYENAMDKFGGDDFGEMLPAQWIHDAAKTERLTKSVLSVTGSNIGFRTFRKVKVSA